MSKRTIYDPIHDSMTPSEPPAPKNFSSAISISSLTNPEPPRQAQARQNRVNISSLLSEPQQKKTTPLSNLRFNNLLNKEEEPKLSHSSLDLDHSNTSMKSAILSPDFYDVHDSSDIDDQTKINIANDDDDDDDLGLDELKDMPKKEEKPSDAPKRKYTYKKNKSDLSKSSNTNTKEKPKNSNGKHQKNMTPESSIKVENKEHNSKTKKSSSTSKSKSNTAAGTGGSKLKSSSDKSAASASSANSAAAGSNKQDPQNKRVNHTPVISMRQLHIKKSDGAPLWRKDIQYDFLKLVFENDKKVFTDPFIPLADRDKKITFSDLYIKTMAQSARVSKVLREKLLTDKAASLPTTMISLLVNVGRMNTTINFVPIMKSQLRIFNSIPVFQLHDDFNDMNNKTLQDTPRLKSILKGCTEFPKVAKNFHDLFNSDIPQNEFPKTNVINLIFMLCSFEPLISKHFDIENINNNTSKQFCDDTQIDDETNLTDPIAAPFSCIFLNFETTPISRACRFLWLMYNYLETNLTKEEIFDNPFGETMENKLTIPPLISVHDTDVKFDVDSPEEIKFGETVKEKRIKFLAEDDVTEQVYKNNLESSLGKSNPKETPVVKIAAKTQLAPSTSTDAPVSTPIPSAPASAVDIKSIEEVSDTVPLGRNRSGTHPITGRRESARAMKLRLKREAKAELEKKIEESIKGTGLASIRRGGKGSRSSKVSSSSTKDLSSTNSSTSHHPESTQNSSSKLTKISKHDRRRFEKNGNIIKEFHPQQLYDQIYLNGKMLIRKKRLMEGNVLHFLEEEESKKNKRPIEDYDEFKSTKLKMLKSSIERFQHKSVNLPKVNFITEFENDKSLKLLSFEF